MCRTLRNLQYTDMIFVMGKKSFILIWFCSLWQKKKKYNLYIIDIFNSVMVSYKSIQKISSIYGSREIWGLDFTKNSIQNYLTTYFDNCNFWFDIGLFCHFKITDIKIFKACPPFVQEVKTMICCPQNHLLRIIFEFLLTHIWCSVL